MHKFAVWLVLIASLFTPVSVRAQGVEPPLARAVLFWMDGCPHCEEVINYVLPPLQENMAVNSIYT